MSQFSYRGVKRSQEEISEEPLEFPKRKKRRYHVPKDLFDKEMEEGKEVESPLRRPIKGWRNEGPLDP